MTQIMWLGVQAGRDRPAARDAAAAPGQGLADAGSLLPHLVERREPPMLKGFKDFIMRGNVVDLAIAVIVGGAFGKVVEAMVKLLMDVIGKVIGGQPNFDTVAVGGVVVGPFITALVNFLILAAVIYFLVVAPMNAIAARRKKGVEESEAPSEEVSILMEIRDELRRR